MVLFQIFLVFQKGIEKISNGKWRINGIVDHRSCSQGLTSHFTAHGHTAKGKVVVPWQNIQLAIIFIQVIIMRHSTGKAVIVHHEGVNCHIFQYIIYIHIGFQICTFTDIF